MTYPEIISTIYTDCKQIADDEGRIYVSLSDIIELLEKEIEKE